jgi:hypothetical protein
MITTPRIQDKQEQAISLLKEELSRPKGLLNLVIYNIMQVRTKFNIDTEEDPVDVGSEASEVRKSFKIEQLLIEQGKEVEEYILREFEEKIRGLYHSGVLNGIIKLREKRLEKYRWDK